MEISAFVVVVALGSLLQGILGFASALVAVPLALLFLPKETVVSSILMVGLSLKGYVLLPFPQRLSPPCWSSPPRSYTMLAGAVMRK
ncbi:MAG TPA: hypothetical protein VM075_03945 [Anaerolineae bacterium]|nr:hypothetical protein [Anaerolineae bacterium]